MSLIYKVVWLGIILSLSLFNSAPVWAGFWDSLWQRELPVDQTTPPKDAQRFEFSGSLPSHTQLELVGYYTSSACTRKEIRFPNGDIANPYRATLNKSSVLRQSLESGATATSFGLSLALQGGGDCDWQLEDLVLDLTLLPSHPVWQKVQSLKDKYLHISPLLTSNELPAKASPHDGFYLSQELTIEPVLAGSEEDTNLVAALPLSLNPVYYPVVIYSPKTDSPFEVKLKSNLQSSSRLWSSAATQMVRFDKQPVLRVQFNPEILTDYQVNVWRQPEHISVHYPDGTEYRYPRGDVHLYAYGKPESMLNTLSASAKAEDKRLLAQIYWAGHALTQDKEKARKFYREAAEGDDLIAIQWMQSQAAYAGEVELSRYWLQRAARLGDVEAKLELIRQPFETILQGKPNTAEAKSAEVKAWQQLNRLVSQGVPEAMSMMALYQALPWSPYHDETAALTHYRMSVQVDPALAHSAASDYYYLLEDFEQSQEFWQIAAERDLYAAAEYADILLKPDTRDAHQVRIWLEKVVSQGAKQGMQRDVLGRAYFQLASLLDTGEGGSVEPERALALYQHSIELAKSFTNDYEAKAKARVQALEKL
ncbi:Sel1 domain protein repeat-containing protein [Shewanella sp. MR-4]|uniref:tetratricopeptide repeat protein n=1 Tax=Shewanella sp. (strain MR-4) TaxID=60480 RepID=UPI00005E5F09|nr:sel1 repeat family protein [Shewanella sp. MR-4]ABI40478.1 Sel1 domain protein repeat-containing protein [Shewanella sp. MR-4]